MIKALISCSGYLAPEYALLGQLTMKADVYSFGILILEIVSGKSSSKAAFGEDLMVLIEWVFVLLKFILFQFIFY